MAEVWIETPQEEQLQEASSEVALPNSDVGEYCSRILTSGVITEAVADASTQTDPSHDRKYRIRDKHTATCDNDTGTTYKKTCPPGTNFESSEVHQVQAPDETWHSPRSSLHGLLENVPFFWYEPITVQKEIRGSQSSEGNIPVFMQSPEENIITHWGSFLISGWRSIRCISSEICLTEKKPRNLPFCKHRRKVPIWITYPLVSLLCMYSAASVDANMAMVALHTSYYCEELDRTFVLVNEEADLSCCCPNNSYQIQLLNSDNKLLCNHIRGKTPSVIPHTIPSKNATAKFTDGTNSSSGMGCVNMTIHSFKPNRDATNYLCHCRDFKRGELVEDEAKFSKFEERPDEMILGSVSVPDPDVSLTNCSVVITTTAELPCAPVAAIQCSNSLRHVRMARDPPFMIFTEEVNPDWGACSVHLELLSHKSGTVQFDVKKHLEVHGMCSTTNVVTSDLNTATLTAMLATIMAVLFVVGIVICLVRRRVMPVIKQRSRSERVYLVEEPMVEQT